MATLATNNPTLADWAKTRDPDGSTAKVVEMLGQTNEILEDATFIEGNLPTGHRTTIRTGLPDVYFRMINQGVPTSKSTEAQVDEGTGMMEAFSEIDTKLVDMSDDPAGFRLAKEQPFLEAMNQRQARTLFYGNVQVAPEEFTGLSTRYSDNTNAASKENVISGGGNSTDNTSIWLIGWHPETVTMVFPKGSNAGISQEDLGIETVDRGSGGAPRLMRAYRSHWKWESGLVVQDWRFAVRIANIDVSNLVGESSAADILKLMALAVDKIPSLGMVRPAFYMNRTVRSMLRIQAMSKGNLYLTPNNPEGKRVLSFDDIPLRLCDQILNTESAVS